MDNVRIVTCLVTSAPTTKSSSHPESSGSDLLVGSIQVCYDDSSDVIDSSAVLQITLPMRAGYPVAGIRNPQCLIGGCRAHVLGMVSNLDGSITFRVEWLNGHGLLCLRTRVVILWTESSFA